MVSYYVSALFTSIPVDEAIRIILGRLEKTTSLPDRCDLSIDQIITLLEFSLNTTYFVCNGVFYHPYQWGHYGATHLTQSSEPSNEGL